MELQANDGVYEKVLSETDVADKMSVPTHWVEEKSLLPMPKPGQPIVLPVKKQNGNATTLRLKARPRKEGQQSYHMKPVFMFKEWRDLVEAYDLKKGDRVYFWREGNYLRVKVRTQPLVILRSSYSVSASTVDDAITLKQLASASICARGL